MYVVYFKTNRNFIHEFPNMSHYVRELYSIPGAATRMHIVALLNWVMHETFQQIFYNADHATPAVDGSISGIMSSMRT